MCFENYFPIWDQLHPHQQRLLQDSLTFQTVKKGAILHGGSSDCAGLVLIRAGQLRALVYSEEGREITIYRLFGGDLCLFCAPCVIRSIQFDVTSKRKKTPNSVASRPASTSSRLGSAPTARLFNAALAL